MLAHVLKNFLSLFQTRRSFVMFKKAHSILALAASATLGAGLLIAADAPVAVDRTAVADRNAVSADDQARSGHEAIMEQLRTIGKDPDTAGDKLFLLNADIDNTSEIRLNEEVSAQDSDPMIKKLADHMVMDHQALTPKLEQAAQDQGITLPHEVPGVQAEEGKIILSMSNKQMEHAYLVHLYVAHQKAIACFESESTTSTNAKVRQLAAETVPTLQEHLAMVERTAGAMGVILTPNEATPASVRIRGGTERPGTTPGNGAPLGKQ
jgi:predicted outer membrane protein